MLAVRVQPPKLFASDEWEFDTWVLSYLKCELSSSGACTKCMNKSIFSG